MYPQRLHMKILVKVSVGDIISSEKMKGSFNLSKPSAVISMVLNNVGSSILTSDIHAMLVRKLINRYPHLSKRRVSVIAAGSVGGAVTAKTIVYRGKWLVRIK